MPILPKVVPQTMFGIPAVVNVPVPRPLPVPMIRLKRVPAPLTQKAPAVRAVGQGIVPVRRTNGSDAERTVIGAKQPLIQPSLMRLVPRLIKPIVPNARRIAIVRGQRRSAIRTLSIVRDVIITTVGTLERGQPKTHVPVLMCLRLIPHQIPVGPVNIVLEREPRLLEQLTIRPPGHVPPCRRTRHM